MAHWKTPNNRDSKHFLSGRLHANFQCVWFWPPFRTAFELHWSLDIHKGNHACVGVLPSSAHCSPLSTLSCAFFCAFVSIYYCGWWRSCRATFRVMMLRCPYKLRIWHFGYFGCVTVDVSKFSDAPGVWQCIHDPIALCAISRYKKKQRHLDACESHI